MVWTPQPCKFGHFSKINWNAKKCTSFTSTKNLFLAHFFSKSCHSKTDKDFSMKPTPNSYKYPNFSVKESRDNLSQSILKLLTLRVDSTYQKNLTLFQRSQSRVLKLSLHRHTNASPLFTAGETFSSPKTAIFVWPIVSWSEVPEWPNFLHQEIFWLLRQMHFGWSDLWEIEVNFIFPVYILCST